MDTLTDAEAARRLRDRLLRYIASCIDEDDQEGAERASKMTALDFLSWIAREDQHAG